MTKPKYKETPTKPLCCLCGKPIDYGDGSVEHILPKSFVRQVNKYFEYKRPVFHTGNLSYSHLQCNQKKQDILVAPSDSNKEFFQNFNAIDLNNYKLFSILNGYELLEYTQVKVHILANLGMPYKVYSRYYLDLIAFLRKEARLYFGKSERYYMQICNIAKQEHWETLIINRSIESLYGL